MLRGIRSRCPRCGEAKLFRAWLKPQTYCPHCQIDWSPQQADDFPAYVAIFLTGHLLAPLIIMLSSHYDLSTLQMAAIIFPLATVMMVGIIQPAKGAIIAVQWWNGMHGFVRERAQQPGPESDR